MSNSEPISITFIADGGGTMKCAQCICIETAPAAPIGTVRPTTQNDVTK